MVEVEEVFEGGEVAFGDGVAEREEFVGQAFGFGPAEEGGRGEAADDDVRGDEVDEDAASLFRAAGVALGVGGLERQLGAVEVVVGEEVAA